MDTKSEKPESFGKQFARFGLAEALMTFHSNRPFDLYLSIARSQSAKWMVVVDGSGVPLGSQLTSASPAEVTLAESTLKRMMVMDDTNGVKRSRWAKRLGWTRTTDEVVFAELIGHIRKVSAARITGTARGKPWAARPRIISWMTGTRAVIAEAGATAVTSLKNP